jgi:hypothetical protein
LADGWKVDWIVNEVDLGSGFEAVVTKTVLARADLDPKLLRRF